MSLKLNNYIRSGILLFSIFFFTSLPDYSFSQDTSNLDSILDQEDIKYQTETDSLNQAFENGLAVEKNTGSKWRLLAIVLLFVVMTFVSMYLVKDFGKKKRIQQILIAKNQTIQKQKDEIEIKNKTLATSNLILEQKVRERTYDLQQSKEQLEQYVYLASHDLRQPLRSISGFSQLLSKELESKNLSNPGINEYLDYIINGVKYMDQLIEDIISYSKMRKDDEREFESHSLLVIFERLHNQLADLIKENDVTLSLNIENIDIEVVGEKIIQVFEQILLNSIHFKKSTEPSHITVTAKMVIDQVHISVSDNGMGIPDEYTEKVFEPFVQLQSKHLYGGTGMGLTLCRKIIEQHDGQIWIESEPGVFTTVFVVIPVYRKSS